MSGTTLADEARTFARHPNARLIGGAALVALAVRLPLGGWRLADAVVATTADTTPTRRTST